VPQLLDEVNALAAENGASIFQVPPYFAYIAKAFSVLEGIGLGIDPNYSIVKETLPYISTRIITDPSPRTGGALATFVYGEAKDDEVSSP
jgi:predicted unusual protein kinase regulating ubiquinone biosynthesis (AarF/ABC1/UbiB family)